MALKISSDEELPTVNMTSMIDVVLVLILFFMVGTQFNQEERNIDIKLPGVSTMNSMMPAPKSREIQIAANGIAYLDGQPVSMLELSQRLSEMRRMFPDLAVAIRADANAKYGDVASAYGAINKSGVTKMAVVGIQNEKIR
jgi:biopolymer transport protein ExbD